MSTLLPSTWRMLTAHDSEEHEQMYREGYVVSRRVAQRMPARDRGRRTSGWTLHRASCSWLGRLKEPPYPAPLTPYSGTVPCHYCKPDPDPSAESRSTDAQL